MILVKDAELKKGECTDLIEGDCVLWDDFNCCCSADMGYPQQGKGCPPNVVEVEPYGPEGTLYKEK